MRTLSMILIQLLFLISFPCFSQTGYDMREGETITVDENGHILNSNMNASTTKFPPKMEITNSSEKKSIYNDDGTFKIPGYNPTGIKEVDDQNYEKAKFALYQNDPKEYNKWFGPQPDDGRVIVRAEEFKKMPDIKRQQILANPSKYYIEDPTIIQDCNH